MKTEKNLFVALAIWMLMLGVADQASAALVSMDLDIDQNPSTTNGYITYDTETGLEWLDISRTAGSSVNQALTSQYVTDYGFRLATSNEVASLFVGAGLPDLTGIDSFNHSVYDQNVYRSQIANLMGLIGKLSLGWVTDRSYALMLSSSDSSYLGDVSLAYSWTAGFSFNTYENISWDESDINRSFDYSSDSYGVFLVRGASTPEPCSLVLLGLGSLVLTRRRINK